MAEAPLAGMMTSVHADVTEAQLTSLKKKIAREEYRKQEMEEKQEEAKKEQEERSCSGGVTEITHSWQGVPTLKVGDEAYGQAMLLLPTGGTQTGQDATRSSGNEASEQPVEPSRGATPEISGSNGGDRLTVSVDQVRHLVIRNAITGQIVCQFANVKNDHTIQDVKDRISLWAAEHGTKRSKGFEDIHMISFALKRCIQRVKSASHRRE